MKELTVDKINKILEEYKNGATNIRSKEALEKKLNKKFEEHFEKKAVLGFDIYRYSQYPSKEQALIPHVFKVLYNQTVRNCLNHEPFIFKSKAKEDFINYFIDAGDGGFQIFDTPFQAIIFAIYFQANIKRYNSKGTTTEILRNFVGEITLRYSLTYDNTYAYSKNYYGPSIINNARIVSKDKLNRFLIDENTVIWFTEELNGIENLQAINFKEDFKNINLFKLDMANLKEEQQTLLFGTEYAKILKVDLLRIGEIKSKQDILSVHSLHIQILMNSSGTISFKKFTISLGNLNSSGIAE